MWHHPGTIFLKELNELSFSCYIAISCSLALIACPRMLSPPSKCLTSSRKYQTVPLTWAQNVILPWNKKEPTPSYQSQQMDSIYLKEKEGINSKQHMSDLYSLPLLRNHETNESTFHCPRNKTLKASVTKTNNRLRECHALLKSSLQATVALESFNLKSKASSVIRAMFKIYLSSTKDF